LVFAKIAKSSVVNAFRPHVFTILLREIRDLWSITPFIWKKLNPFRVHFMRSFNPHVGSFHSPTWGYQKHNSYRVAMLHNAFIMQYSANCKTIFRLFIPHVAHFIRQRGVFRGTTRTELRCHTARLWCCITRIMQTIFRPFIPHVGSFHSPTWGLQRHNSYRVAMLY